jgi:hypothetical protein
VGLRPALFVLGAGGLTSLSWVVLAAVRGRGPTSRLG